MANQLSSTKPSRRATRQRAAILRALQAVKSHPSAQAVHDLVRKELPGVSLATIYRNLGVLRDEGLALELRLEDKRSHYDGNADEHYHAVCTVCGQISDIDAPPLQDLHGWAGQVSAYSVDRVVLEIHGVCPSCSGRKEAAPLGVEREPRYSREGGVERRPSEA